jgi:hypothetical protein
LVNTSNAPIAVTVILRGDDGRVLSTLPVTTTQQGGTQTVMGGSAVLNPNATALSQMETRLFRP